MGLVISLEMRSLLFVADCILATKKLSLFFLSHKLHVCNLNTGNHIVKKVWKKKILPIHISNKQKLKIIKIKVKQQKEGCD